MGTNDGTFALVTPSPPIKGLTEAARGVWSTPTNRATTISYPRHGEIHFFKTIIVTIVVIRTHLSFPHPQMSQIVNTRANHLLHGGSRPQIKPAAS